MVILTIENLFFHVSRPRLNMAMGTNGRFEMKLIAKIAGENPALVKRLTEKGIAAKLVKGGIVIELKEASGGKYEVPAEASRATLSIECAESGGALTNRGWGEVICGLQGQALRPYYMPRGGHLAGGTHAYFSVPGAVVTISCARRTDEITITKYSVVRQEDNAWLKSETVWEGVLAELPDTYGYFSKAAQAAHDKANCYHCRSCHYKAE